MVRVRSDILFATGAYSPGLREWAGRSITTAEEQTREEPMRVPEERVGWRRAVVNILIGIAVGVLLVEVVSALSYSGAETKERRGVIHEGTTG